LPAAPLVARRKYLTEVPSPLLALPLVEIMAVASLCFAGT
jgi:hypothetical protein